MLINSAKLIYFSPTGTTKKILHKIAEGLEIDYIYDVNLTLPDARNSAIEAVDEDIAIIGVPVYEEKVPEFLRPCLSGLKGFNKPVVIVSVYGNIGGGISLNELKAISENCGFWVAAAGSFIGEHSFSTKEVPVAEGRPDLQDMMVTIEFGRKIKRKLMELDSLDGISISIPPGRLPLIARLLPKKSAGIFTKAPSADMSLCNRCGVCAKVCPVSAIDANTLAIDDNKCLRCFSCVRKCNKKARKIIYRKSPIVTRFLANKNKVRKEPVLYL